MPVSKDPTFSRQFAGELLDKNAKEVERLDADENGGILSLGDFLSDGNLPVM